MQTNTQSPFIYVILIICIGAAVAAGYFAGQNRGTVTAPTVTPATTVEVVPTPTTADSILLEPLQETSPTPPTASPAPTVKTKTFKNSRYQFEYPAEWIVSDIVSDEAYVTMIYASAEDLGGPRYRVSISEDDKNYLKVGFADQIGTKVETGDKIFETKTATTVIGGVPAMITKTEVGVGSETDAMPRYSAILDLSPQGKPDKVLRIGITGSDAETQEKLDVITKRFKLL